MKTVRTLKTHLGKNGLKHPGDEFEVSNSLAEDLVENRLVEIVGDGEEKEDSGEGEEGSSEDEGAEEDPKNKGFLRRILG